MVTINGLTKSDWEQMVLFSDVPNIVTYSNADQGTRAFLMINIGTTGYTAQPSGQTITINGETIQSVTDISQAGGRFFYLGVNYRLVAPSIVDALRNCPNIAASYDIFIWSGDAGDIESPFTVMIRAKSNGSKFNFTYDTTITDTHVLSFQKSDGQSNDSLKNETIARVQLQMYKYTDFDRYGNVDPYGDVLNDEEYVATLVKTYYSDEVRFDISPILSTFAEYGRVVYFRFIITLFTSSSFEQVESVHNLYTTVGYRCNHSIPYISRNDAPYLLQNVGNGIDWTNLNTLYVYKPRIDFSWLTTLPSTTFTIKYLDSAYNVLHSQMLTDLNVSSIDRTYYLNEDWMMESSYIAVQLPNNRGNLLYTIIKGINAANRCTRIYWRNEYGGISFFDFTGNFDKEISIDSTVYSKGNLNYYDETEREMDIVYDRTVKHEYTVNTHLIDKQGTQIFESIAKSRKVWIVDDETNQIEDIIIDSVDINQDSSFKDIYVATVKYHMSREN